MSLRPDDHRSGKSSSRRTRDRSASRSEARVEEPPKASKSKSKKSLRFHDEDDDEVDERILSPVQTKSPAHMPAMPGGFDEDEDDEDDHDPALAYEPSRQGGMRVPSFPSMGQGLPSRRRHEDSSSASDSDAPRSNRRTKGSARPQSQQYSSEIRSPRDSKVSFFDQDDARGPRSSRQSYFDPEERVDGYFESRRRPSKHVEMPASAMPYPDADHAFMPAMPSYPGEQEHRMILPYGAERVQDEYDEHLAYTAMPLTKSRTDDFEARGPRPRSPSRSVSYPQPTADAHGGRESRRMTKDTLALEDHEHDHEPRRASRTSLLASREAEHEVRRASKTSALLAIGEPEHDAHNLMPGAKTRNGRLSVSGGERPNLGGAGKPPASPLLEAYHGTYQSASPMPSPMMLPANEDGGSSEDEIEEFSLEERKPSGSSKEAKFARGKSESKESKETKTGKKRVKLYDAEGDAEKLAKAMNHHDARTGPLIEILTEVTHDQLLALREEYKKRVKVSGRGVNMCKQIKATTSGNFGKAAYVTSLGRWESESYWANFWYQSHASNRELLIEALMGKPNAEMREINDSFKDKRYDDSLSRCMEKELKPDKFRTAVLTALEARRQEETDVWPLEYRNRDVEVLHRALKSREGGESAILEIVVRRSDNHLREILKTYERVHRENFARAALGKSNNLVGEVIAHILNGVINRPARDCLLLRHAIKDVTSKNKDIELRYELLMSRLIRLHWDRAHLGKVKAEYENKYGMELEQSVREASKGDFGAFCVQLCET